MTDVPDGWTMVGEGMPDDFGEDIDIGDRLTLEGEPATVTDIERGPGWEVELTKRAGGTTSLQRLDLWEWVDNGLIQL